MHILLHILWTHIRGMPMACSSLASRGYKYIEFRIGFDAFPFSFACDGILPSPPSFNFGTGTVIQGFEILNKHLKISTNFPQVCCGFKAHNLIMCKLKVQVVVSLGC